MSTRVLAVAAFFEPGYRGGGPIKSMAGIIDSAPNEYEIRLLTQDHDLGDQRPYPGVSGRTIRRGPHDITYVRGGRFRFSRQVWLALREEWDIVYVNGLWDWTFDLLPVFLATTIARKRTVRIVVAPRGQLSPGALVLGRRRLKQVFIGLWKLLAVDRRVVFHASADMEAAQCRQWLGAKVVLVVTPDPVQLDDAPSGRHGHQAVGAQARESLEAVFVSRITEKKNLLTVVRALRQVQARVNLTIYGPVESEAYWNECRSAAEDLPPNIAFNYGGALLASDVIGVFRGSDVFLFPTWGENFGHVIAESLAAGCPVVCGRSTPWGAVLAQGGGVEVDPSDEASIAAAVEHYAAMGEEQRAATRYSVSEAYSTWRRTRNQIHIFDLASNAR